MRLLIESLECRRMLSGVVVYSNLDGGAGPASPRPNSSAAAAQFDAAAAAIGNVSIITFEGLPTGPFSSLTVAPGVVLTGADSSGNNQNILNASQFPPDVPLGGFNTTAGGAEFIAQNAGTITFTFASPVQFFGAYFSGVQNFFADAIQFSDGTSQSVRIPTGTVAAGGLAFAGFIDAGSSISSITIDAGTASDSGFDGIGVDDVRYQSPAANKLVFAHAPTSITTGALGPVTVDVEDGNGNLLSSDNSDVTIFVTTSATGALLTGTTTVAAVNGVATFSDLSLGTAGSYTATATDGTFTSAVSPSFTVYAPPKSVGALDPTYGVGGIASHDVGFTSTDGTAQDLKQSVVIGTIGAVPNESFGVTRFNADGSLDTSFGAGGVVSSSFNGTDDAPSAVTVLPSGQILVAGTATTYTNGVAAGSEFVVAEYNADGSVDTSFGDGDGDVLVSFASGAALSNDVLKAMVVNLAGVIYLGGSSDASGNSGTDFALVALNPDGSLDNAAGGKILRDFAGGDDVINSLAVQANSDIVAAGSATVNGVTEIALARFLTTGLIDKHFGTKGTTTTKVRGVFDSASSVVIQPADGEILIGGLSATGSGAALSSDFVVARYTAIGRLDRSFGHGPVITSFGQPSAITQLLLQGNGEVVASGKTISSLAAAVTPDNLELAIARYTTRGVLDTSFNQTGKTIINLGSGAVSAADQQIVTAATIEPLAASSLGAEFAAFISSSQGAESMTTGGAILDAGNNGTNTIEAELVTAGIDLAGSLLATIPAAVTGGAKGVASVAIAEDGTDQATGSVTIELQAATDALGDGATTFKSIPEKINLRHSQHHSYRISFNFPQNLTAGNYYLVAVVDDDALTSYQDLNEQNNLAANPSAVNIAPAFVNLVGASVTATSTFTAGKAARVSFTLTNDGNVIAKGATVVDLRLSYATTIAGGAAIDTAKVAVNLPATPKPHIYHVSFKLPASVAAGTYYLIAVIDPLDSLGVIDKSHSTVVDAVQVVVKG
jgi:uncharacterized delta-60 repeat protein